VCTALQRSLVCDFRHLHNIRAAVWHAHNCHSWYLNARLSQIAYVICPSRLLRLCPCHRVQDHWSSIHVIDTCIHADHSCHIINAISPAPLGGGLGVALPPASGAHISQCCSTTFSTTSPPSHYPDTVVAGVMCSWAIFCNARRCRALRGCQPQIYERTCNHPAAHDRLLFRLCTFTHSWALLSQEACNSRKTYCLSSLRC
jgi:hypothetical protein